MTSILFGVFSSIFNAFLYYALDDPWFLSAFASGFSLSWAITASVHKLIDIEIDRLADTESKGE